MSKFVVITEDQRPAFEAAGYKVDIQYVVDLDQKVDPTQQITTVVRTREQKRTMAFPTSTVLNWTGKMYGGKKGTDGEFAYLVCQKFFKDHGPIRRGKLNKHIAAEFQRHGKVFNASVVTNLCHDGYLGAVTNGI